jgi:hypothetical protein
VKFLDEIHPWGSMRAAMKSKARSASARTRSRVSHTPTGDQHEAQDPKDDRNDEPNAVNVDRLD